MQSMVRIFLVYLSSALGFLYADLIFLFCAFCCLLFSAIFVLLCFPSPGTSPHVHLPLFTSSHRAVGACREGLGSDQL